MSNTSPQHTSTRPGFWASPLSAEMVASASIRLGQTALHDGVAYWTECRPQEAGRTVVVAEDGETTRDLFPAPFDARSRVHEYGGGAFCIGGGFCWFVNAKDQAIYRVPVTGGDPVQVCRESNTRLGDLHWDGTRARLLAVAEVHAPTSQHGQGIENNLLAIDVASGRISTLQSGADFYAYPRVSPDGRHLSWLEWQNPNMPWDNTSLYVAELDIDGLPLQAQRLDDGVAIFQPEWTPNGELLWSADHDNWWNIYNRQGALSQEQAECGQPLWNFNMATWAANESDVFGLFSDNGQWRLAKIGVQHAEYFALPFSWLDQLRVEGDSAVALAGSATRASCVIRVDLRSGDWQTIKQVAEVPVSRAYLSEPQSICFDTTEGEQAYGLYYPPSNDGYALEGELPPLMVRCHGGPSAATHTALELKYQFWTSRGFAVLDVNYRGSTGYGRAYRRSLYGHWGVKDVVDAVNGAKYLADKGLVNAEQLFISGSSAGGFTVLSALTFYDQFTAGASYYGIGDLRAIMDDTHKFEARYGDQLIGPYDSHAEEYIKRSPLFSVEQLSCPVIFFQGLDDKIVPPNQAQMMADALKAKGIHFEHYEFAGESHGFRKQETIVKTLEAELAFYQRLI
ncbi:MAG: prolyl oligopeptidase family serine peptidase [Gammaproteobacteria bacterium]|nr:prolyl oligopeptidase family serine peptidase [Gammaproteobacteria bacterium]